MAILLALAPEAIQASAGVRTVSPGALERPTASASPCPTFSWAGVDGVEGYELAVIELVERSEPRAVLRRRIEGSASSFTPDRTSCLPPGAYAWTVRAIGLDPATTDPADTWATPRRFEVEALPSAAELEAALETLRRWQASGAGDPRNSPGTFRGTFRVPSNSPGTSQPGPLPGPSPRAAEANVAGTAAIRGEMPGASGETYGVVGVSASPQGAGLAAVNTGGGADLVLDGATQGQTDTRLFHEALDRPSGNPESFDFRNSGAGAMTIKVDGVDVVTTATDQDSLGALACPDGQIAKRVSGTWQCASDASAAYTAGNQLQLSGSTFDVVEGSGSGLDADTLDGLDSTALATTAHGHFGASWTGSGTALTVENLATTGNLSSLVSRTYTETGAAVYGQHGHPSAAGFGVYGLSDSSAGVGVHGGAPRYGVVGEAWAAGGFGVRGLAWQNTGAAAAAVQGVSYAVDGNGIWGAAPATTGEGFGVYGQSSGNLGVGLYGWATHASGATYGVFAESTSTAGTGVAGKATAATGATRGVYGETASTSGGVGVYGKAGTSGLNFGVVGEAGSVDSISVYGLATSTTGNPWGVYGETRSTATNGAAARATGVYGNASGTAGDALGVAGGSASPAGAGIFGVNSAGGWAGFFQGKLHVNGALSKASGSFKIDHPLDPEGKYLYHSFVESPDMMNVYNGNVTLDEQGEAWIELPTWFEALNRDFRYQLTPLGEWSACWVGRKIEGNRFLIRGGARAEVSWQVTGIRHDKWAEAHRIPVEETKPDSERGSYLHPEVWGQPTERGLGARLDPAERERSGRLGEVATARPMPREPRELPDVPAPRFPSDIPRTGSRGSNDAPR